MAPGEVVDGADAETAAADTTPLMGDEEREPWEDTARSNAHDHNDTHRTFMEDALDRSQLPMGTAKENNPYDHMGPSPYDGGSLITVYAPVTLLIHMSLGVAAFSLLEGWNFRESLYFVVVTVTTVGYGDYSPQKEGSRMFWFFYVLITLCMAGVAMGEIAEMLVERAKSNRGATEWETKVYGYLDDLISVPMRRLVVNLIVLLLIILFGAIAVHFIMGHSMIVSLYHATATVTTIGYGDVDMTVKNVELSQWFHIFYCLVAATWAANLVGSFAEAYIQWDQGRKIRRAIDYGVTEKMLKMIDTDGDGVVSRSEFVAYMIIKLNKIDKECIQQVESMFDELDIDNSGTLDRADIRVGRTDIESNPTAKTE